MIVWILDRCGYDARGGNAEVYSTEAGAKASVPDIEWRASTMHPDEQVERRPDWDSAGDFLTLRRARMDPR